MTEESPVRGERIAKAIARAGICSRREAERLIAQGRVSLDGRTLDSPAVVVEPGAAIAVDGEPIPAPAPTRLWRYHKPRGLITTARDPQGRPTVFERLPPDLPRVLAVGRLDLNSEGLLLLTNDGALKRRLELPATGWIRRYRVRVHGTVEETRLAALAKGITVDGVDYGPIEARLERRTGTNAWLSVALREGKNREVRKVLEHLGLTVNRLIRTAYGPFQLGNLAAGALAPVPAKVLREQLGKALGEDLGGTSNAAGGTARPRPRRVKSRSKQTQQREAESPRAHAHRRRPT
ncbi:MAG TPA: pseudouridine synthase [Kiloniellales bacterium]|nr:pseudouridine synthase [Kiloniellales bacterium]